MPLPRIVLEGEPIAYAHELDLETFNLESLVTFKWLLDRYMDYGRKKSTAQEQGVGTFGRRCFGAAIWAPNLFWAPALLATDVWAPKQKEVNSQPQ